MDHAGARLRPVPGTVRLALALLAVGLITGLSVRPALGASYLVDPARTRLVVQTFKDGVAARLAHDHAIDAREVSGRIEYDPAAPEATTITVTAKTASLRADEPSIREALGLAGDPSAKDRAAIQEAMRSPGQLDSGGFPEIRFVSSRVARQPDGRLLVTGVLTLRGVSREVAIPVEVQEQGHGFRGRGRMTLRPSQFGIPPYSALLGAIRNKDEVTLHVDLWVEPGAAP